LLAKYELLKLLEEMKFATILVKRYNYSSQNILDARYEFENQNILYKIII